MTKIYPPSKIFITGAGGFIGSHTAAHLAGLGYEVTALLRKPPAAVPGRPLLPKSVKVIYGDLLHPESYLEHLPGHEAALNLAADYRLGLSSAKDRASMYGTNVTGALNFLSDAHKAGIKFLIQVSSTAALGETHGRLADETHFHNGRFRCYYEETKHIAHRLLEKRRQEGWPLVLAVLGGVSGPGDTGAVTTAMREFFRGRLPFQVTTTSRFQLCAPSVVAKGFELLLKKGQIGQNYILAGAPVSMPQIFEKAAALAGRRPPKALPPKLLRGPAMILDFLSRFGLKAPLSGEALNVMDGSTYTYSSQKAQNDLGWNADSAGHDFELYLKELYEAES